WRSRCRTLDVTVTRTRGGVGVGSTGCVQQADDIADQEGCDLGSQLMAGLVPDVVLTSARLFEDGVNGLFECGGLRRGARRLLLGGQQLCAEVAELLAAEPVTYLREPAGLLLIDVMGDVLDEDGRFRVELFGFRTHCAELHAQQVGDMVLLVGLEDIVLEVRQQPAHLRIHDLVLDIGMHGQQLDHLRDQMTLLLRRILSSALKVAEDFLDLLVVLFEQNNRISGHIVPFVVSGSSPAASRCSCRAWYVSFVLSSRAVRAGQRVHEPSSRPFWWHGPGRPSRWRRAGSAAISRQRPHRPSEVLAGWRRLLAWSGRRFAACYGWRARGPGRRPVVCPDVLLRSLYRAPPPTVAA